MIVIGINHKTAPVDVRERFSFTRKHLAEALAEFKDSGLVHGAVILSTCNRTEVYADAAQEGAASLIFGMFNAAEADRDYFYVLNDSDCVRHLFRVASGLDSQVLGETQVLAQVRSAWAVAKDSGATGGLIDRLFTRAQEVGSAVRGRTKISQGNISIGSVAIKMLEENVSDLGSKSVLIVGAGKIGALISEYLLEKRIKGIFVASRTYAKAAGLASECGGRAVDFESLEEELKNVDIVISSTASPHIVLKGEMISEAMRSRPGRPLFILDLALPRDVDPEVRGISGVSLYDLDDLKNVVEDNYNRRRIEAALAEDIVRGEAEAFSQDIWQKIFIED